MTHGDLDSLDNFLEKKDEELMEVEERAEEEKHYAASINAEQLRGKAGGLYDPTIRMESAIENLPREELMKKLSELQNKGIPIVGEENIIEHQPEKENSKNELHLIEHEE